MKPSLYLAIAAVLSGAMLGTAPIASAQLSASSSFDGFRYRLVDLTPGDGIDPGVSFLDASVSAAAMFRDDNGATRESVQAGSAGGPVQVLIDTADGHFAGNATRTSASSMTAIVNGAGETFTDSFLGFVLAPYTQVTFSIDTSAIGSAVDTPGSYAFSFVAINSRIIDENGNVFIQGDGLSSELASSDILSVSLSSAAVALTGTLEFATAANVRVQPIPEPAPMAMLIAGLAVVGGLARRRA